MTKLYISGQISGLSRPGYLAHFEGAAAWLRKRAYDVVNPLEVPPSPQCACPLKSYGMLAMGANHTWECSLRSDIPVLLQCDGIVMLPNWRNSRGAQLEMSVATSCGLRLMFLRHADASTGGVCDSYECSAWKLDEV